MITKKPHAQNCDKYRLISLIKHITTVSAEVIHNRTYAKFESETGEYQFGFRNAFGIREAIFSLKVLIQRYKDIRRDAYIYFIDFAKAFDNVKHEQLIRILQDTGLDRVEYGAPFAYICGV